MSRTGCALRNNGLFGYWAAGNLIMRGASAARAPTYLGRSETDQFLSQTDLVVRSAWVSSSGRPSAAR